MGQIIATGTHAPDFTLDDQFGNEVTLSGFAGKKVLLSFHPLAWTGVCADQMKALEEAYDRFEACGVVPLGMSVDASPSKKAWGESLGLRKLRLLADFWPHGGAAGSLGVFRENDGFSERANILLDETGKVIWAKVYEIKKLPDLEEIFAFLK